jgi:hypothetical protein
MLNKKADTVAKVSAGHSIQQRPLTERDLIETTPRS